MQKFSCAWNCYYCPSEPGQPKSYLHDEPAVKRANENHFDPVLQFTDRAATLAMNGHPVDKVELLVLGGTWASYPHAYQEEFIRDLFFAANTFWVRKKRERRPLLDEQTENETAAVKIIGITLETRPDTIDAAELRRLRRYGCTRVQLGLQHTDDAILRRINRGCDTSDAITALRLLKNSCYKVDVHLMPSLPGAELDDDRAMFERMLSDPDLQARRAPRPCHEMSRRPPGGASALPRSTPLPLPLPVVTRRRRTSGRSIRRKSCRGRSSRSGSRRAATCRTRRETCTRCSSTSRRGSTRGSGSTAS